MKETSTVLIGPDHKLTKVIGETLDIPGIMRRKGITKVKALSDKLGTKSSKWTRVRKGTAYPSLTEIRSLQSFSGCIVPEFITENDPPGMHACAIRAARYAKDFSQIELSAESGVPYNIVVEAECGLKIHKSGYSKLLKFLEMDREKYAQPADESSGVNKPSESLDAKKSNAPFRELWQRVPGSRQIATLPTLPALPPCQRT